MPRKMCYLRSHLNVNFSICFALITVYTLVHLLQGDLHVQMGRVFCFCTLIMYMYLIHNITIINNLLTSSIYYIILFAAIGEEGEALKIYNISRYCEDVYECVANNNIEPDASKRMKVNVECKYHIT